MQYQIDDTSPFYQYILEVRKRLLQTVLVFSLCFALFFYFSSELIDVLMAPLLLMLPHDGTLISTKLTSSFTIPIRIALDVAFLAVVPFALIQAWCFISPGLYRIERRVAFWAGLLGLILFGVGGAFCFYWVLPFLFQLSITTAPVGVRLMPDIVDAIDFVTRMLFLFGVCFQVPLMCFLLVQWRVLTLATLKKIRPYAVVSAFILGMLLTPPDVLSQVALAIPLCLLYELGILLVVCSRSFFS